MPHTAPTHLHVAAGAAELALVDLGGEAERAEGLEVRLVGRGEVHHHERLPVAREARREEVRQLGVAVVVGWFGWWVSGRVRCRVCRGLPVEDRREHTQNYTHNRTHR